jgi:hypothetical protein
MILLTILLKFLSFLWVAGAGIDQYNALAGVNLTRGRITNLAVATGVTTTMDIPCGGTDFVTVEADLTAAAAGDLTMLVFPYEADGLTLMSTPLPAVAGVGFVPTLVAGHSQAVQQYNVQGIDKVQLQAKNNNAGGETQSW